MIRTISIALALSAFIACTPQSGNTQAKIPVGSVQGAAKTEAVATFAEGCFWHTEIVFQSLKGVRDAVSGYAGGHTKNPTYEVVGEEGTGHAESVQVYYDPAQVSFRTLVQAFFASQDPTQVNGQGNDRGPQYRSIAFYRTPEEKAIIDDEIAKLKASGKYKRPIATEVVAYSQFYPAEAYHQEYASHHADEGYVRNVTIPDYLEFRKTFKGPFKN